MYKYTLGEWQNNSTNLDENKHMKRFISNRGNVNGANPDLENRPDYVKKAIDAGFDVKIDVWYFHGGWWLGSNEPAYAIDESFLYDSHLWIQAKHPQALAELNAISRSNANYHINFFFHQKDEVTLTSGKYVWTAPTKIPQITSGTIITMPEDDYVEHQYLLMAAGVCSNLIENIRKHLPKVEPTKSKVNMVLKPSPFSYGFPYRTWEEVFPPKRKMLYTSPIKVEPKSTFIDLVTQRVISIVSEQLGLLEQDITNDSHFVNDFNADELDAIELIMEFEDEFDLYITDEDADKLVTVGNVIDYIKTRVTPETMKRIPVVSNW